MCCATATRTICRSPRAAPAPATTGRLCRCTAEWCSIWRAWIASRTISPEGVAVCEPGVRLGVLENEARKVGWELRCYPSTIVKASLGGFLGGGSGGIGSVAHGNLRDFQTVRAIEAVTMEAEPRDRAA